MNIKLSNYTLSYSCDKAKIGDKVCPANGLTKVGTIVKIVKHRDSWEGNTYTIVWNTGRTKGVTSEHPGRNLVKLNDYMAAIREHVSDSEALLKEANQFGL